MEFKEQHVKLPVVNFDKLMTQQKLKKRHGELLPNNVRPIFFGPSNCGKTNALLSLITHPSRLKFENVYVYSVTRTAQVQISQVSLGADKWNSVLSI